MGDFSFDEEFYRRVICRDKKWTKHIPSANQMVREAVEEFYREFDYFPDVAACAPGKFTIMGDHVEYADGYMVHGGLPLVTVVVGNRTDMSTCTVATTSDEIDLPKKINFPSATVKHCRTGHPSWANFVTGIVDSYPKCKDWYGFDAIIHSSVPMRKGFGSSAALQVAIFSFLEALNMKKTPNNEIQKANICKQSEELFVGNSLGCWSNFTATLCKVRHGTLIDCRRSEVMQFPMRDPNIVFLLIQPNVRLEVSDRNLMETRQLELKVAARLLGLEHIKDANECHLAVLEQMNDLSPREVIKILEEFDLDRATITRFVNELFDTQEELEREELGVLEEMYYPLLPAEQKEEQLEELEGEQEEEQEKPPPMNWAWPCPVKRIYTPSTSEEQVEEETETPRPSQDSAATRISANIKLMKRVRHVLSENRRSRSIPGDCTKNDYVTFGYKLTNSHYSLKDDYCVSCPALDRLVEICNATEGVLGAKMVAGGTILAMMHRSSLDCLVEAIFRQFEGEPVFHLVMPSQGTRFLKLRTDNAVHSQLSTRYDTQSVVMKKAVENFDATFRRKPSHGAFAPGVVSLVGEQTEYNQGLALPMAVPMGTAVVGAINATAKIRVATTAGISSKKKKIIFQTPSIKPISPGKTRWGAYVRGVVANFQGYVPGFDCLIQSSVPLDGGMASSASLEVAMYSFLEALTEQRTKDASRKAYLCMKAEHEFTKTLCGVMNQTAAVRARRGSAMLLNCRNGKAQHIPFPDRSVSVLVIQPRSLKENKSVLLTRLEECYQAARAIGVDDLGKATESDISVLIEMRVPLVVLQRARHVITEKKRVQRAVEALASRDYDALGEIMVECHVSLREDFGMCSPPLESIVDKALEVHGVLGARMTPACVVALVKKWAIDSVIEVMKNSCKDETSFYVTEPSSGCEVLDIKGHVDGLLGPKYAFENVDGMQLRSTVWCVLSYYTLSIRLRPHAVKELVFPPLEPGYTPRVKN